jgi:hypothetical protein
MSYFATISGRDLSNARIHSFSIVPAEQAQDYVRRLVPRLAALDGEPVYFCDDTATGTSHDFIGGAQDHTAEHGTLAGHPMTQLLDLCDRTGAVLRIWLARDGPSDFEDVVSCKSTSEAARLMLEKQAAGFWNFRIAP